MFQLPREIQELIWILDPTKREHLKKVIHQLKYRFVMIEFTYHSTATRICCEEDTFLKTLLDAIWDLKRDGYDYNMEWIQKLPTKLKEIEKHLQN